MRHNPLTTSQRSFIETLYLTHASRVAQIVRSLYCASCRQEIEECVAVTFAIACEKADEMELFLSPELYLYQIARNVARRARKDQARHAPLEDLHDTASTCFEEDVIETILYQTVYTENLPAKVLSRLGAEAQKLYRLRYVDRLTIAQIAEATGKPYQSVSARLSELRQRVVQLVQREFTTCSALVR
ncbi:MAG: hypothetical protein DBY36_05205 [Clostridiales bacterium]|nr:MAG: hypothetical protein DBY36_05205 [Clostridiales bacterium]